MARKKKQTRIVSMSISAPVYAQFTVERAIDDDGEPGDWMVTGIRNVGCDLTPTLAMECMTDDDRDELDRLASSAQDEPC